VKRQRLVREEILAAARETLIRHGFEGFSMRKVASEAGCSPGTIYLYFRDREDLIFNLVEEAFDTLLEELETVDDTGDPAGSLRTVLRAYVDFGLRHPDHYRCAFVIRQLADGDSTVMEPHQSFDGLRAFVGRCADTGRFENFDVETTSQVLWSAIHGITSLLIVMPGFPWVERERLIDEVIDTAIRGALRPREREES
jgi:AcrR family transcriptional regulator